MPYIKQEYRDKLDSTIDQLAEEIKNIHVNNSAQTRDGLLNYSLTRLLNNVFADARYHDYNELIGMLECCKLEYYRKSIGPYEELKETENGSVKTFNKGDQSGY
jgi:hypothetical protein